MAGHDGRGTSRDSSRRRWPDAVRLPASLIRAKLVQSALADESGAYGGAVSAKGPGKARRLAPGKPPARLPKAAAHRPGRAASRRRATSNSRRSKSLTMPLAKNSAPMNATCAALSLLLILSARLGALRRRTPPRATAAAALGSGLSGGKTIGRREVDRMEEFSRSRVEVKESGGRALCQELLSGAHSRAGPVGAHRVLCCVSPGSDTSPCHRLRAALRRLTRTSGYRRGPYAPRKNRRRLRDRGRKWP